MAGHGAPGERRRIGAEARQADLREWFDTPKVDGIFHLASPTAPAETYKHAEMTLQVNTDGTHNLIEVADFWGARFLFASSVKVTDQITFNSTYIAGKREGERLCAKDENIKVARMGNVYGPRMAPNDSRVIPTFCRAVRDKEPLRVWGDGQQVDSFCYVSDVIKGLISFMQSDVSRVVEFGDSEGITIEKLAHTVIDVLEVKDGTICYEQPGGGVCLVPVDGTMSNNRSTSALHAKARKVPDTSRAMNELRWSPRVGLPDGLRRTYEYYKTIGG
jgi:nucleoside-diphosphate-sugar epimerase